MNPEISSDDICVDEDAEPWYFDDSLGIDDIEYSDDGITLMSNSIHAKKQYYYDFIRKEWYYVDENGREIIE